MRAEILLSTDFVFFTTRQFALANGQSIPSASQTLRRLASRKTITRVTKGIWANTKHPYFTPIGCVPLLLGAEQGYVSFLTALHRHGAISQIPSSIQVATTGHTRKLKTPIGTFEFLQLDPRLMKTGIQWSETKAPYRMAELEKALIDTLYISTRRGNRFESLPEVDAQFAYKKLKKFIREIPNKKIRISIEKKLQKPAGQFPHK